MKIVTFMSFKGGAGKTTALMAIASCLIKRGKKIAIFEADINRPISRWRNNAKAKETWDDACQVFIAETLDAFESAYAQAEENGTELVLVDAQGGGTDLNDTILVNSKFVVLPTALTSLDTDETLETYQHAVKLAMREQIALSAAILKTRVPTGKLTVAQNRTNDLLDKLPVFTSALHSRNAFEDMKFRGLLHKSLEKTIANPNDKLFAKNFQTAIDEADAITLDILGELEG
ncbi:AAA family ATPase [Roseibium sp. HPY-6]|uniref:nucleotide-binding protein n=1 Tax=Roseibium sp. HPY-6 TaxID=3229852 RepID=UPI00338E0FAF